MVLSDMPLRVYVHSHIQSHRASRTRDAVFLNVFLEVLVYIFETLVERGFLESPSRQPAEVILMGAEGSLPALRKTRPKLLSPSARGSPWVKCGQAERISLLQPRFTPALKRAVPLTKFDVQFEATSDVCFYEKHVESVFSLTQVKTL